MRVTEDLARLLQHFVPDGNMDRETERVLPVSPEPTIIILTWRPRKVKGAARASRFWSLFKNVLTPCCIAVSSNCAEGRERERERARRQFTWVFSGGVERKSFPAFSFGTFSGVFIYVPFWVEVSSFKLCAEEFRFCLQGTLTVSIDLHM